MDPVLAELIRWIGNALIAGAVTIILAWMAKRTQDAVMHNTAVTQTVHALVNNAMSVQLLTTCNALEKLARVTGNPRDASEARDSRRLYEEHVAGQNALNQAVQQKIDPISTPGLPDQPL